MRIVISGTVGVGKSSTTKELIKILKEKGYIVNYLKEETVNSPYLKHYYDNPESWAFIAQMDFLLERFKQWVSDEQKREKQKKEDKGKKIITVYDRHFLDDYIFAELHSIKNSISQLNSIVYQSVYKELIEKLHDAKAEPDFLFLLDASLPTIVKRLHKRGREEEKETNEEYWKDLYDSYYVKPKFVHHFKTNTKKVVKIDTEKITPNEVANSIIKEMGIK